MPRFDPERLQEAITARGLTVKSFAKAARVSPSTAQAARSGSTVSLRALRSMLRALEAIPELPHLDLLAGPSATGANGTKNADRDLQPVGASEVGEGGTSTAAAPLRV